MLTSRDFLDRVELFEQTNVLEASGKTSKQDVSKGLFPAQIREQSGYKAMLYQEKGLGMPVVFLFRFADVNPYKIAWGEKLCYVKSIKRVNEREQTDTRGKYLLIEATFKV